LPSKRQALCDIQTGRVHHFNGHGIGVGYDRGQEQSILGKTRMDT
jgi:hypothetical protein